MPRCRIARHARALGGSFTARRPPAPPIEGQRRAGQAEAWTRDYFPVREAVERDLIQAALDRHRGNVAQAADERGLDRTSLHRRISTLRGGTGGLRATEVTRTDRAPGNSAPTRSTVPRPAEESARLGATLGSAWLFRP